MTRSGTVLPFEELQHQSEPEPRRPSLVPNQLPISSDQRPPGHELIQQRIITHPPTLGARQHVRTSSAGPAAHMGRSRAGLVVVGAAVPSVVMACPIGLTSVVPHTHGK